jgi:hypothetical protein
MAGDKITERFTWVQRPHLVSAQCLVQALDTHLLRATGRMALFAILEVSQNLFVEIVKAGGFLWYQNSFI